MSETISGQRCKGARLTAIAAFCTCYRGCQLLIPAHCCSSNTNTHNNYNNNTSLRHITQILPTRIKSLQHSSAEHLLHISAHLDRQASLTCRFAVGIEFPSLPDFAPSKTCIRQPTSHELYPHLPTTKHTTNTSSKWSTTLEPLPAVAPATTVSYSPTIPPSPGARCLQRARHRVLRPALECLTRAVDDDIFARQQQHLTILEHSLTSHSQAATPLTRPASAPPRVPPPATTAATRVTFPASAPSPPRRRPATSAARPVTCPASAPPPRLVLPVVASAAVLPAVVRSATSAARSVTLPVTAVRAVPASAADTASSSRVATAAVPVAVSAAVSAASSRAARPATLAVASAT
jgi:hypothetical protein